MKGKPHSVVGAVCCGNYSNMFLEKRKIDDDIYEDIIKIETDIILYDKNGKEIKVHSISPQGIPDVFAPNYLHY